MSPTPNKFLGKEQLEQQVARERLRGGKLAGIFGTGTTQRIFVTFSLMAIVMIPAFIMSFTRPELVVDYITKTLPFLTLGVGFITGQAVNK